MAMPIGIAIFDSFSGEKSTVCQLTWHGQNRIIQEYSGFKVVEFDHFKKLMERRADGRSLLGTK